MRSKEESRDIIDRALSSAADEINKKYGGKLIQDLGKEANMEASLKKRVENQVKHLTSAEKAKERWKSRDKVESVDTTDRGYGQGRKMGD